MNSIDIYDKDWIDLVFEGRNKHYGAYELRRTSGRTTISAFFYGLLFLASVTTILILIYNLTHDPVVAPIEDDTDIVIKVTDIFQPEKPEPPKPQTQATAPVAPVIDEKQLDNPAIVKPEEADQNIAKNENNTPTPEVDPNATPGGTGTPGPIVNNPGPASTGTSTNAPTGPVSTGELDKLPEYPGGINKFREYVGDNFRRPDLEEGEKIRINVMFIIEKDGTLSNIRVARNVEKKYADEAIRVLKSMKKKWTPGILKGQPVATAYTMPITLQN